MATPTTKTEPLYQKDGHLYTHTSPISSVQPLSSLPPDVQTLFKPPPSTAPGEPYILTTPSTIFHAQGGGQPSDTGTITAAGTIFTVHQVRTVAPTILHMGTMTPSPATAAAATTTPSTPPPTTSTLIATPGLQQIDPAKRTLHSRLHTAGHLLGLAAAQLKAQDILDGPLTDGKASHYPGASFVEFHGLIPSDKKPALQSAVDALVAADLPVLIEWWSEERARGECTGVLESFKQGEEGVRVVRVGEVGSYPCGGTHVRRSGECGRVVVRNVKRQKGVTKVSYEVVDA